MMNSVQTNIPSQNQPMQAAYVQMNKTVLMSGAEYFSDEFAINALYNPKLSIDIKKAVAEHARIAEALQSAGVIVKHIAAPPNCQDGVYTANWGLARNGKILMSRLPNKRKPEEAYALRAVTDLGLTPITLPDSVQRFSGQGDALPCGDIVFVQSPYRTTIDAHPYLKSLLGFKEVVALQTKPVRWFGFGPAKKNKITSWPDSPTYDLDLALAILKWPTSEQKGLIAYCPTVFKRSSRRFLANYDTVDKIEISCKETLEAFALNLVSTGQTVVMNSGAPAFQASLEAHGLKTATLDLPELKKGGGSIRCATLTLDNL